MKFKVGDRIIYNRSDMYIEKGYIFNIVFDHLWGHQYRLLLENSEFTKYTAQLDDVGKREHFVTINQEWKGHEIKIDTEYYRNRKIDIILDDTLITQ